MLDCPDSFDYELDAYLAAEARAEDARLHCAKCEQAIWDSEAYEFDGDDMRLYCKDCFVDMMFDKCRVFID